jgi:predicted N-acetyltransferase YhbS
LEIREIRDDEADALGELTVRVYEAIGATEDGDYVVQLRDVRARMASCTVLVAVDDDGRVVGGVAYVPPTSEWADVSKADEAEFRMLAVDPDQQGRGIGEALVQACIDRATADGKVRLALLSNHMMKPAHRLYERLGFVRAPERDLYISAAVDLKAYLLTIHP